MLDILEKIVLIGAGNVGYHLGKRLVEKGHPVIQVFSRTSEKAKRLAAIIHAESCSQLEQIRKDGTLYILAVSDDAIGLLGKRLSNLLTSKALVVHTSGATPSTVLAGSFTNYGVFYPLQTFSINRSVKFDSIPICIDAVLDQDLERLRTLAASISSQVHQVSDQQRAILHVAAVFVNNFTNYLFSIGYDILKDQDIPFTLLQPLMEETVAKLEHFSPKTVQTGPAIRDDQETMERHLNLLKEHPAFQAIYRQLSQGIQTNKNIKTMRILGYIDHPTLKITVFKMDNRLSVKFESGLYEQTYKFRSGMKIDDLKDIQTLVDAPFIQAVLQEMGTMHRISNQALMRYHAQEEEDFEEII